LSRTVRFLNRSDDWYVRRRPIRIRSCGDSVVTSSPKKRTRPAVGGKSPVMALNSVVLPAPLAPISARRSPAATENETFSIALSAPNVRVTPSSTRASPVAIWAPLEALTASTRSETWPRPEQREDAGRRGPETYAAIDWTAFGLWEGRR
jgi:hypothetical protein